MVCRLVAFAWAFLLVCPSIGWAHSRRADPDAWWRAWNWDPLIVLSLVLLLLVYCRGLGRLWTRVSVGWKVSPLQAACYFCALAILFVALLSPLDALSEELSSLHMVQHMLLMTIAAPLFVVGSPSLVLAWGLPEVWQGSVGPLARFAFRLPSASLLWRPLLTWMLFAATLWVWHHPALYQAALRDPLMHDVQHLSFFVAACLFWRMGLDPLSARRLRPVVAIPYFFSTSLHATALGVFLALSPRVWYDDYVTRTQAWGLMPLQDQQLAGLIMWMPACLIYPIVAAILLGGWLASQGETTTRGNRPMRLTATEG